MTYGSSYGICIKFQTFLSKPISVSVNAFPFQLNRVVGGTNDYGRFYPEVTPVKDRIACYSSPCSFESTNGREKMYKIVTKEDTIRIPAEYMRKGQSLDQHIDRLSMTALKVALMTTIDLSWLLQITSH